MTRSLTLIRPDDFYVHFRDGAVLAAVVPETARDFGRAIVMPNLVPPVVTTRDALAYRARIMAALPEGAAFIPLMTLYLTEDTDPGDLAAGAGDGAITAVKLYPAGATTNSASGVKDMAKVMPVLEKWPRSACRSVSMAKSPIRPSIFSIAKRSLSTPCLIRSGGGCRNCG